MASSRFEELEKRIKELRHHFLPVEFDPTGLYDENVYELTRAFRVLTHAEFESFIEDRVIEVVDDAVSGWKSSGVISTSLLAIMAHRESTSPIPGSLTEVVSKRGKYSSLLEARIQTARSDLHRYARNQNHGIKEKNLLRMLLPIGFQETEIDSGWLSATETWATARGDTAHKTSKLQVQPNPQNELKTVTVVLEGFREIDAQMEFK
ncbi:HEPN domain-containing protein [Streptomyces sp. NPDC056987]|uniref:HEPN domain-containing protein n=1 Tax=Streptomyces sp. NPDC056987 TaxID=3345988 RepID=UPI0036312966